MKRKKMIKYLGGKCWDCDKKFHFAVYDIHSMITPTKCEDPYRFDNFILERSRDELDNCNILCANCHRKHHDEVGPYIV